MKNQEKNQSITELYGIMDTNVISWTAGYLKPWNTHFNSYGMRYNCSHLKSLNSSLASEIDYSQKSCRLQSCNVLNLITCTNFRIRYSIQEGHLGLL